MTQDETGSKKLTHTSDSILKVRVKARALCRGLYFSQKTKPTSLQSHPGCKVSGSRLYRGSRQFPGVLDSGEADRKAFLKK